MNIVPFFVNYSDSWNKARNFGGDRHHEGTDIMSGTVSKKRGEIPVLSMSDGVVEQIGWLKLGGYRVGIRSPKGVYFSLSCASLQLCSRNQTGNKESVREM